MCIRGTLTSLRPATSNDVERLVAWHDDPDVARFWDDERFTAAELRERLARHDVESWIVEAGDEPVGYLQALHAWRKAGYVELSQHPPDHEHTAVCVLMECRR